MYPKWPALWFNTVANVVGHWPAPGFLVAANVAGWLLSNLTVLGVPCLVDEMEGYDFIFLFELLSCGLFPWLHFLVVYLFLTPLLRDRLGGWMRTQVVVILIAWLGGFGLLLMLLPVTGGIVSSVSSLWD